MTENCTFVKLWRPHTRLKGVKKICGEVMCSKYRSSSNLIHSERTIACSKNNQTINSRSVNDSLVGRDRKNQWGCAKWIGVSGMCSFPRQCTVSNSWRRVCSCQGLSQNCCRFSQILPRVYLPFFITQPLWLVFSHWFLLTSHVQPERNLWRSSFASSSWEKRAKEWNPSCPCENSQPHSSRRKSKYALWFQGHS